LSSGGEFLYRFNAAFESCDSFRQGLRNRRVFLAPVVTWRISQQSEVTAYAEYLRSEDPTDSGLPVIGTGMPPLAVQRPVENGGDIRTKDLHLGVRGSHAFNDQWTARYHFDGRWLQTPQAPQLALADDGLDPGTCTRASCPVDQWLLAVPVSTGDTYYSSL